ncbi:MAG: hypothetical protein GX107_08985 [Clostridiales bacterium]|nr:hypothetical protein [Clostridiales bacterium]
MSEDKKKVTYVSDDDFTEEQINYVYQDRRYVGTKETAGYVLWDMAQSFNINNYSGRFVNNILQIDFGLQQVLSFINGIWDVINDVFTAAIVDKTRTRWGKFKPYLVILALPGTLGTMFFWMMPLFFPGAAPDYMPKFITYFILAILREGAGTFRGIAQGGLLATITPHPVDRTRLITLANFASGALGEKLPGQIMTVIIDLIDNGVIKPKRSAGVTGLYTKLFVWMGVGTTIVGGAVTLWFNMIVKERVAQSIERPSIIQGIRSIINNKPILLMTLQQILGSFSIGGSKSDYYIDVLHFASLELIAGIPGAFMHPVSYMIVPWFRRRFSTKFLYISGQYISDILMVPVFLIGCIGGKKNGKYKNKVFMGIVMALEETIFMIFYGVRKVIPAEMSNEAMDYCEWKNGYRTEAMTSVAKGLASKLAGIYTSIVQLQIKKWIGYDQTRFISGSDQSDDTKFWLFASFAILPSITGAISIVPMLFYDLSGKKRERMYAELLTRRNEMSAKASSGDVETMKEIAAEQMAISEKNKHKKL